MDEFMDEFMDAMREVFPNLLVQFEDFSTDNAFKYLSRFRQKYRCFNDDVSAQYYRSAHVISDTHVTYFRFRARVQSYFQVSSTQRILHQKHQASHSLIIAYYSLVLAPRVLALRSNCYLSSSSRA
jgi:hypothetical protein